MKTDRKISFLFCLIALSFLCFIFYLNRTYSFSSDDCCAGRSAIQQENVLPARLSSLGDVWLTNAHAGYRPVVHLFGRFFAGYCRDKIWFDLANTVVFGLLLTLLLRLAHRKWDFAWQDWVLAILPVYLILAKGESYLWCAGSVNYLWAGTITLGFVLCWEKAKDCRPKLLSWIPVIVFTVISGWVQESFVLPVLFALGWWNLIHIKSLTKTRFLLCMFYAVGAALLCMGALRRASSIESFSFFSSVVMTQIKIWAAIKGVWLCLILFLFIRDKRAFLVRNLFELLVVLGSYLMISVVGFNGERSLWCCNLFAIMVFLREFRPPSWVAGLFASVMVLIAFPIVILGTHIKRNFDEFLSTYLSSDDYVTYHERVNCGLFGRFFHQANYKWQVNDFHGLAFAHYYGRPVAPLALPSKEMYEQLYLTDTYCIPERRLPIEGEFYTTPESNTIVMPLGEKDGDNLRVVHQYDQPGDLFANIKFELDRRKVPPVADFSQPRVLTSKSGRRYLLIGKYAFQDNSLRGVKLVADTSVE